MNPNKFPRILGLALLLLSTCISVPCKAATPAAADAPWAEAASNGKQARRALLACWRFVQGWLQHADPQSGLIPRNLSKDLFWNAKDAAADNYPFMVLSSYYTYHRLYSHRMHAMLKTEQRLCNRIGVLPDDYVFATHAQRPRKPSLKELIFGASEYAKDGLLPITELLGPSPWSQRMLELLDEIWKHRYLSTEVGKLPATSNEVAGDLMQTLCRMYWMTGKQEYRQWAYLLADYFLAHHLPTQQPRLDLDDHGCEFLGGLSEVYYLAAQRDPERRERWRPVIHQLMDRILEVGRDEHGLFFSRINPITGQTLDKELTDNWGYNYNAYLVVAQLDNVARYRLAVENALHQLPHYRDYPWEGDTADGIADSLESAINLIQRIADPQAIAWADHMAERLLAKQRDTGVIEGWHGDGNFARTALMFALWKTQGTYLRPWRADLRLGAARDADGALFISIEADWPWQGTLHFDIPRHQEYLHLPTDYPRLNQFPEWFTVAKNAQYATDRGPIFGTVLRQGLPLTVTPEKPYRLKLQR